MSSLYSLTGKVKTLSPARQIWQFKISAALLSHQFEQEEITDESNEEVKVTTITRDREPNTYLIDNEVIVGNMPIHPGITVITADTQGGKTTTAVAMANALAQVEVSTAWVTLQETSKVSPFFSSLTSLAETLITLKDLPDVIIIDSFRLTQFGISGGSTRAGGVSSKLFELLTELNNAAETAGVALVILFNPMAKDETAAEILNRDTKSSVNQVLTLKTLGQGTFTSRISDDREEQAFTLSLDAARSTGGVEIVTVKAADLRTKTLRSSSYVNLF